jgi:hypothetical protein
MKLISDISKKIWILEEEPITESYSINISIGFRDNEKLPVKFDKMQFEILLKLDEKIVEKITKPELSQEYMCTDQDFIEFFTLTNLFPEKNYKINVYSKNYEDSWEETFSFTLPKPKKPYESWIYDEENYKWIPPVPYPYDGKNYVWDENEKIWIEFKEQ